MSAIPNELPWHQVAGMLPGFAQWVVQRYGPQPEMLTMERYEELKPIYERENPGART